MKPDVDRALRDDERARLARERLAAVKNEFSRLAVLALKGQANPDEIAKALRAVDAARAALRRAEVKR